MPRVFGILSIIFSCLVFISVLIKSLSMATYSPQLEGAMYAREMGDAKAAQEAIVSFYERTRVPKAVTAGALALMSLALFMISLGQLRYRPWARPWTLGWACGGLLVLFAIGWIEVLWVHPNSVILQTALDAAAQGGGHQAQLMAMVTGIMTGSVVLALAKLLLYLPYPIILLIYFTRQRVKTALMRTDDVV
ncbi:MAG: hypothetical protein JRH20_03205 [Deltaproteobacteria bacterium]|nr:hypothetical protein [Deltaproteobacteria bacterium]